LFCFFIKNLFKSMNQLTIFEDKPIRSLEHEGELWFSVVDIIAVLSDSPKPSQYWNNIKKRDEQLSPICLKLKLPASYGKSHPTDCANTEGVFRIIQSVPSPKAEPFKKWLANLGKQAIDEATDPALSVEKARALYKAKGYTDEWIERRMQSIETRRQLTDEWKARGVTEGQEYSILTAAIAKGTFGVSPSEHSQLKDIGKQNLRDHMTPLELIFTALGEEATRSLAVREDVQGFNENHDIAQKGGEMAGFARRNFEEKFGEKVVSAKNYLSLETEKGTESLPEDTEQ
jgi:DNA-damage-inducible protein D